MFGMGSMGSETQPQCSSWVESEAWRSRSVGHGLKVERGAAALSVMGQKEREPHPQSSSCVESAAKRSRSVRHGLKIPRGAAAVSVMGRVPAVRQTCPRVKPEGGGGVGERRVGRQASSILFCQKACSAPLLQC